MGGSRGKVLAAYADGLRAIERHAGHIGDWSAATPCERWRAVDLAGHLLAIARYTTACWTLPRPAATGAACLAALTSRR